MTTERVRKYRTLENAHHTGKSQYNDFCLYFYMNFNEKTALQNSNGWNEQEM